MKKAWRWIFSISLSIACVGLVFCIAGGIMGASSDEVEELLYEAGVGNYVRTAGDRIEEAVHERHHYDGYDYYDEYKEEYLDAYADDDGYENADYEYSGIDELKVEVPAMSVYVMEREDGGDDVHVGLYGVPDKLCEAIMISQDGGKLKIETKDDKSVTEWLKNEGDLGTLYIELPNGRKLNKASLEMGAGYLSAENINALELDVEVGAGEVYILQFDASKVDVQCGTGQAYLSGTVLEEIEIECGIGSVTFYDSGSESDYEYKLDCGIGEVRVGNQYYSGLGSTKEIKDSLATKKMKIECGIGSVEVYFD